jgi:hypothetical protein
MRAIQHLLVLATALLTLTACEKEIVLKYDESSSRLVIEGEVTPGNGPHQVRISRSVNFTEPNSFPAVENATVTITDDQGEDETLVHEGGGVYRSTGLLTGVVGHTYTLSVSVDGNTITGASTMPMAVPLDTLSIDSISGFGNVNLIVVPIYTDPVGIVNYYRIRVRVNGEKWPVIFARDDLLSDGQVNGQPLFYNEVPLEPQDVVSVDLLSIDRTIFNYWYTLESFSSSGGVAPADPTSNLSGNVLGYFSAHAVSTVTVVVP